MKWFLCKEKYQLSLCLSHKKNTHIDNTVVIIMVRSVVRNL